MGEIAARAPGFMAAIIGLTAERVEGLYAAATGHGSVEVANENGPHEIVVSGERVAVERVMDRAEEEEGGVAVPLDVAGAFHSRMMAPGAAELAAVTALPLSAPRVPVVANVTADIVRTPAAIHEAPVRQVAGRVRRSASLHTLAGAGARVLIETGPGRVLTRLARGTVPEVTAYAAEDVLTASASAGAA